jgi:general transcription factor 3C polypeptide 3 (transcription factor C subunit 4)
MCSKAHLDVLHGPMKDDFHVHDYPYLFRKAADELFAAGYHEVAMTFYQPLEQLLEEVNPSLLVQIGRCFLKGLNDSKAGEYFKAAIKLDESDVNARMELARMYERIKQPGAAFNYVTEIMKLQNNARRESNRHTLEIAVKDQKPRPKPDTGLSTAPSRASRARPPRVTHASKNRIFKDGLIQTAEYLQNQYQRLKSEHDGMRTGDVESSLLWMDAAEALTNDFRSFKPFYPWDKYVRFIGYSGNVRLQAETSLEDDLKAMAQRLSKGPQLLL